MRRQVWFGVLCALAFVCGAVGAAEPASPTLARIVEHNEVRVGMSGDQPPFVMTNREGELIGFEVDLARALADSMGVKLKIVRKPFAQLLPGLARGEMDMVMSGLTMTPQRSLEFTFVGPYYVSGKSVLTRSEALAAIDASPGFNQDGLSLVALEDSTSQAFVQSRLPKTKLTTVPDYETAVKMMIEGKAQAMVADLPACVVTMLQHPDQGLMTSATLLTMEPIGVALPPGDTTLESFVANVVEALEATGKVKELSRFWFEGASWLATIP